MSRISRTADLPMKVEPEEGYLDAVRHLAKYYCCGKLRYGRSYLLNILTSDAPIALILHL